MTNKIDAIWFNTVGIVRVMTPEGTSLRDIHEYPAYYIGPCRDGNTEEQDKQHIANWGTKFSAVAGDLLFGDYRRLDYDGNSFYGNDKSLKFISDLISEKEMSQVRKSAQISF